MNYSKLDNPAWHSLSEFHQKFAIHYNNLISYHPAYCPFGGYSGSNKIEDEIREYSTTIDDFFIVGEKPLFPKEVVLKRELVCLQMVVENIIQSEVTHEIVALNGKHEEELFDLVTLVQPGYFKRDTSKMGNYVGIFSHNKLVAATGERMKMNDFTEVSAVVTHPDHVGKGYAKQLVTFVSNRVFDEGKIPYLHVTETNAGAIGLYEKLGYRTRRKMSLWNFVTR